MSQNWNLQRGGGFKPKKPSVGGGGYGYLLEQHNIQCQLFVGGFFSQPDPTGDERSPSTVLQTAG